MRAPSSVSSKVKRPSIETIAVRKRSRSSLVQANSAQAPAGTALTTVPAVKLFNTVESFGAEKFMRRIPYALIEAAKIDGAGEWQVFSKVCMPQCRAALYSIAILVFIDYWNMVEQPIVLLPDAEKQPLSVYLSTINTGEVGLAFAIATIYMVPTLLLFLHGEEYLVEGIATQGSVKG